MPLVPRVGRRHPAVMLGIGAIYLLLGLGAVTMVYPFLVTVTSAMTNDLDYEEFNPYPKYWFDRGERYLKYLAEKYAEQARFDFFKAAYRAPANWGTYRDMAFEPDVIAKCFPLFGAERDPLRWERIGRIARDYEAFLRTRYATRPDTEALMPLFLLYNLPAFQEFTQQRYERLYAEQARARGEDPEALSSRERERRALDLMAQIRGDVYVSFADMTFDTVKSYAYDLSKWLPKPTPRHVDFIDWTLSLPPSHKMPVTRHYLWTKFLYDEGWDAARYNQAAGTNYPTLLAVPFPVGPVRPAVAELRETFVRDRWPARLMRLKGDHRQGYRALFRERFQSIAALNKVARTAYRSWDDIPYFETLPYPHAQTPSHQVDASPIEALSAVWRDYVLGVPVDQREMICPETDYQHFLLARYGTLEAINAAYGWSYTRADAIELPIPEADYFDYISNESHYFWKFCTHNFGRVLSFMATKGRALWNTVILVLLTIAATLTVNPLAAYALSRFELRRTPQILTFLLATMAFPAEVAMIPAFLLLRDLGLLNTFAALVLPGLANGFSIFLLKGFFDSLPKELYEAASLDGATELRMFTTITFPLCKPILAVIALGAFMSAYGSFMWAFLVCQNESMWTLMVWLYQFQQKMRLYPYMTMAALVMASIPTLLVFLFCQKIILRGIIIPTMK